MKDEIDTLSQKELSLLLKESNWNNKKIRNVYYLVAVTGITFDEALSLEWNDVDFNAKFISIRDERKKLRLVPINSVAHSFMDGLPREGSLVFDTPTYSGDEFYSALEKSGINTSERTLYPESVRASFLKVLKNQGHSSETISRVYGLI